MNLKSIGIASFLISLFILLYSCNNANNASWRQLPEMQTLDSFSGSSFSYVLESPVDLKKNVIYVPVLKYAWHEVLLKLKGDAVLTKSNSSDFKLFNTSTSHKYALDDNEYTVESESSVDGVYVRAFFNKTLPFKHEFNLRDNPLRFMKNEVKAFGLNHYDPKVKNQMQILYYKDDEHFIVKLIPEDTQHEIILSKGLDKFASLSQALEQMESWIKLGNSQKKKPKLAWKYYYNEDDDLLIPRIKFHFMQSCHSLIGETFLLKDNSKHIIADASMRVGFVLSEKGAVVEAEAYTLADSAGGTPKPKQLHFNKPFLVTVRHVGRPNPYFVMHVANADLMEKTRK